MPTDLMRVKNVEIGESCEAFLSLIFEAVRAFLHCNSKMLGHLSGFGVWLFE